MCHKKRLKWILFFFIPFMLLPYNLLMSSQKLAISGRIRNDFTAYKKEKLKHSNITESRVELQYKTEKWKIYMDTRVYYNTGEISNFTNETTFSLVRSFIRYHATFGDLTLGKTYINLGTKSIFNPFESDKQLAFSDLQYAKEGLVALALYIPLGELSGWQTHLSSHNQTINGGTTLFSQLADFDIGVVLNRASTNQNMAGIYIKGDLEIGVHSSLNAHFNDRLKYQLIEYTIGIDYSIPDFVFSASYYYNSNGFDKKTDYDFNKKINTYFQAKHYLHTALSWKANEFFTSEINSFINMNDKSFILLPQISYKLASALQITFQFSLIHGSDDAEFSTVRYGKWGTLTRLEAKF